MQVLEGLLVVNGDSGERFKTVEESQGSAAFFSLQFLRCKTMRPPRTLVSAF